MTSRSVWLLSGIALGCASLPSCTTLRPCIVQDTYEVPEYTLPPEPVALPKSIEPPRTTETPNPAIAGKAKYPPPETVEQAHVIPEPTKPKDDPQIQWAPLVLAVQSILDDRHQEALRHLQAYDAKTQEFYLRILPPLTLFAKKRIDELSTQEVAVVSDQLHSLLATLRPRTELAIDRMCCCEWVKAYGIYQPLREGHAFVAPLSDRPAEMVRLYVELRNFASVPRGGCFETRLSSTIEIHDAAGQKVQVLDFKDGKDPLKSLTRLNDYYNTYTFPVPNLPPGTYQLVLQIADETVADARRLAQKAMEFRIAPAR